MIMGASPGDTSGKLSLLTTTGSNTTDWGPSSGVTVIDRANKRLVMLSSLTGAYTVTFNLVTNAWSAQVANGGYQIYNGTTVLDTPDGKGYIRWGTQYGVGIVARSMILSNTGLSPATGWSNAMSGFSEVLVNGVFYLFGGIAGYSVDGSDTMYVRTYTLASNTVANHGTTNSTIVGAIYNSAAGTDGTDIYVFGGYTRISGSQVISYSAYKYDIATKTWSILDTTVPFRIGITSMAAYYQGKFYFIGGSPIGDDADNTWVWRYTVASNTWEKWKRYDEFIGRRFGTVFVYNDLLYYFCSNNNGASSGDIYTITLK